MPNQRRDSATSAIDKRAIGRGVRAAVPAIVATAVVLGIDSALRAATTGTASPATAALSAILVLVVPPALVALAMVALLTLMQRREPDARMASLAVGLSTLAWIAMAMATLPGTIFGLVVATTGALIGIVMTRAWTRLRRIVLTLLILAVALAILGLGV